jgi:3-hydroxyisobutyrate dehydrogenase-like beta-hydroxyacid dehydrogenase
VAAGATAYEKASDLAEQSELLSICVTSDNDVREVLNERNVLNFMRPGSVIAIHSTVTPGLSVEVARDASRNGIEVLEAPVSGSSRAALNRTLLVMVGGRLETFEKVKGVFEAYGNPVLYTGACGTAMRTKLLNNLMAAAHKGIAIRCLLAARHEGIDSNLVQRAVLAGVGASRGLEIVGRLQGAERARHIGPLVKKDMKLAREALGSSELDPLFALADEAIHWIDKWAADKEQILAPC